MLDEKTSCEQTCQSQELQSETKLIVITGGPGAGKTALLEFVRKVFCHHVAVLPEAASILFGGGFWRLNSHSAKNCVQRAIFHVQVELENLVVLEKKWTLGLCDRGTLDGLAYWQGSESDFFSNINSTKEREFAKYKGVIHLSSPKLGNGYNCLNPLRNETPEAAAELDRRIQQIWSTHPNYLNFESTPDFFEKLDAATTALKKMSKPFLIDHCQGGIHENLIF